MSLEHVPAPQLASPAGAAFGAFFLPAVFCAGFAGVEGAVVLALEVLVGAGAAADVVVESGTDAGATDGVEGAAAPVEGVDAPVAAGASVFAPVALPEHDPAEHDA